MNKLAIVTTHPIQYNAPWFKLLTERGFIKVKVFYTWSQSSLNSKYDPGFNREISWDIPLLNGYEYSFVTNISKDPGPHHFRGINNPGLISEISSWEPDSILVIGWNFISHLKCIRHFHGKIPVLFRGDSTLLNEKRGVRKFIRTIFLKWVYKHVDRALYVGTNNKKYFLRHGVTEDQLVFTPHAVDNVRFSHPDPVYSKDAEGWRRELNISEDDIIVLYAGKFEEVKNLEIIIKAADRLKEKPVHFILLGNGVLEDELKIKAQDKKIIFLDFQNQSKMPVVYRLADIFILPSKSETWGLGINEAMACSRAILASNKCGCAVDLVQPGHNGFIFESGNEEDLGDKLDKIISDKSKIRQMGENSFRIIQDWSFEKICEAVEDVLINKTG